MHQSWKQALAYQFQQPYFKELSEFVREERQRHTVFPAQSDVFAAYELPLDSVKVLILGQDPYHNAGQAHGLSFSVLPGVRPPPSLVNIFKELRDDLGIAIPKHGFLKAWADQGVFLLNSTLTVRAHEAGSHQKMGWEQFTDATILALSARELPVVFVLWGKYARDKALLIDDTRHTVIESAHPSPMSAHGGFFGSRPFSKVNAALERHAIAPINWAL